MSYPPQPYQQPQQAPYGPPPQYGPPQQFQPPHGMLPAPVLPPRKPKTWTPVSIIAVVVAGIAALCVGAVALASGDDEKPTAAKRAASAGVKTAKVAKDAAEEEPADGSDMFDLPVGSTMTVSDGGSVQEGMLRSVKAFSKGCVGFAPKPDNGLFVVVDVLVVQKRGTGTVSPLDFMFVADDGTSAHAMSALFSGCAEPSLASADLRAGQRRAGKIAFDVNSKVGTVEWAPGGLGADTVGSWKVG